MTCGAAPCQRGRHNERCRAWHAANAELSSSHYKDVVEPFRERQPDYQRRWRLWQRLREIREKTRPVGSLLLASLRALLCRAEALVGSPTREAQTGALAGDLLDKAQRALRGAVAALEQFEANVATLQSMGL